VRIKSLQKELEQANEDKTEAADALRHSERRISDVNRSLRELERDRKNWSKP
jgi:murein hydrolase activator